MKHSLRRTYGLACASVLAVGLYAVPSAAERSELDPQIGYNYGEIETPRSAAMAGATRAVSSSLEGLFLNPANMAASRVYHLGALAQIWPEASRQSFGAGAVDSIVSSSKVAGGIGGTWNRQDPDGVDREYIDLRLALAFPFSESFFVGLGGRYLMLGQEGWYALKPSAASAGLNNEKIVNGFAIDAGATVKPTEELALSIVGSNINDPGNGFQPATFGGGIGFGAKELTIEADILADFTSWDTTTVRAMAGLEFLAAGRYPLRAGYRYDEGAESHMLAGGVGYVDQAFAAEIAVHRTVVGDAATAVVLGFRYHLEAGGLTPSAGDTF
jgi:opacity protein-like surface antigen